VKADGFCATYCVHVVANLPHVGSFGHTQLSPAQSPQKAVLKVSVCWLKCCAKLHPLPPLKRALGWPQDEGVGWPLVMSDGTLARGQKYMLMVVDVHSMAYTPPLGSALKPLPKEVESLDT